MQCIVIHNKKAHYRAVKCLKVGGDWIRTSDLFVPNEARYRAALRPENDIQN